MPFQQETWMHAFLDRVSILTRKLAIQFAPSAKAQLEYHSLNFKLKGFEFDDNIKVEKCKCDDVSRRRES